MEHYKKIRYEKVGSEPWALSCFMLFLGQRLTVKLTDVIETLFDW